MASSPSSAPASSPFLRPSAAAAKRKLQLSSAASSVGVPAASLVGVGGRPASAAAALVQDNLLKKLTQRQLFGKVRSATNARRSAGSSSGRPASGKFFSRLPGRLAFCLKDVMPQSAIEAGHIFLGFSKCGQFLISYTQTTADSVDLAVDLSINYNYRLHWWQFVPYRRAKKTSEVLLFTDAGVPGGVALALCHWPNEHGKIVVFGTQTNDSLDDDEIKSSALRCYMTVTAVPSLKACKECAKVAASYEEDEMAAAWNSCVRLSCLEHGMTVHTNFDLVPPHPKFEPRISMKRDGTVVVNAGNFLHAVHIHLERLKGGDEVDAEERRRRHRKEAAAGYADEYSPRCGGVGGLSPSFAEEEVEDRQRRITTWSELNVELNEFTLSGGGATGLFSPISSVYATSDSETTDCESEAVCSAAASASAATKVTYFERKDRGDLAASVAGGGRAATRGNPGGAGAIFSSTEGSAAAAADRAEAGHAAARHQRTESVLQAHAFGERSQLDEAPAAATPASETCKRQKMMAEKAYEIKEEDFNEGVQEKLSTFRKKRLADKKYEFSEENSENIVPLPRLRSQKSVRSPSKSVEATAAAAASPPRQKSRPATTYQSRAKDAAAVSARHDHKAARAVSGLTSPAQPARPLQEQANCTAALHCTDEKCVGSVSSSSAAVPSGSSAAVGSVSSSSSSSVPSGSSAAEQPRLTEVELIETLPVPELLSPGGMVKKDQSAFSPRSNGGDAGSSHPPLHAAAAAAAAAGCHAKFTRRYIELDDEMISVITDIEDDDLGSASTTPGYHSALPLEVHGTGYQPMSMISNAKAEKLSLPACLTVQQRSLDLEHFCHDMAQRQCQLVGKKYWFCSDYDVEIVDVDPGSGEVIAVAVVQVQAATVTKRTYQYQKYAISSVQRNQYQACFRFCWNIDTGHFYVVDSEPLKEISTFLKDSPHGGPVWHPARSLSLSLQRAWGALTSGAATAIRCVTNEPVIRGESLQTIVDTEHLVAIILDKLD